MPSILPRARAVSRAARVSLALVGAGALLAACDGVGNTVTAADGVSTPISQIIVQPKADTLVVRDSIQNTDAVQLRASVIGFSGTVLTTPTVRWSSANPAIATVDSLGVVRPVAVGTTTITARSGGKDDQATIVVRGAVSRVALTSTVRTAAGLPVGIDTLFVTDSIRVTDRRQLRAVSIGANGDTLTGARYTWTSSNPAVATVDSTGLVQARGIGTTTITVVNPTSGARDTHTVVVSSVIRQIQLGALPTRVVVGDTARLTATAVGFDGRPIANVPFVFRSTNTAVARVDSTTGLITFVGPGTASFTASAYFVSASTAAAAAVTTVPFTYQSITAGWDHSCAIAQLGRLDCWGRGNEGQLGVASDSVCADSDIGQTINPSDTTGGLQSGFRGCVIRPKTVPTSLAFVAVAAGDSTTCGIANTGRGYCWGSGSLGKLGNGRTSGSPSPTLVTSGVTFALSSRRVVSQFQYLTYGGTISVGGNHACGISVVQLAYCWGDDSFAQLGDSTFYAFSNRQNLASSTPIPVDTLNGLRYGYISAGFRHTCALTTAGAAYCWGYNVAGETGTGAAGATPLVRTPRLVVGAPAMTTISAGSISDPATGATIAASHTCGVSTGGAVYCWGDNTFGQLGTGAGGAASAVLVAGGGYVDVSAGGGFTCAVRTDGGIDCWGRNDVGQIGNGPPGVTAWPPVVPTPTRVANAVVADANGLGQTVTPFYVAVAAGRRHACGLANDGWVYCWGSNVLGALGDQLQAIVQRRPIRVYRVTP